MAEAVTKSGQWTLDQWKLARQRARTDLLFLCNKVLGYKDVCKEVHGPIIESLQKFKGGKEERSTITVKDGAGYAPYVDLWSLDGPRKNMVMIPRGHLKSTVATIAHSIQWIINYPDIRILLSSGTDNQVKAFLDEIKKHFQFNEHFRFLFPEYCPQGKNVKEFGNQERFTVPNRSVHRKEPTISTCTVGSIVASGHYEVVKNDDLVDKENVRTPEQMANVKSHFSMLWPLVETSEVAPHHGWLDLIGTIYHFSDLHYSIYLEEKEIPQEKKQWNIVLKSAAPNYPEGPVMWPKRVPLESLKKIESDPALGPDVLYTQYLMNPRPSKSGLVDDASQIRWIPESELKRLYAYLRLHVTVDLAGMEPEKKGQDNDYTVVNLHGFGNDGSLYILELLHSRNITPLELIEYLFKLYDRHPRIFDIKVEKEAHARVLLPFLRREMSRRKKWLPLVEIKRDNRTSKQQRIKGLQPWFRNGSIRFSQGLSHRLAMENEILFFPKYAHDDILDTIADAMQNRDGGVTSDVSGTPQVNYESDPSRPWWAGPGEHVNFGRNPETVARWREENREPDHTEMTGW